MGSVDEVGVETGPVVVVVVGGVVSLAGQDGDELGAGVVVGASFAGGFELTTQGGGSGAVAIAEESVVFGVESGQGSGVDVAWEGGVENGCG